MQDWCHLEQTQKVSNVPQCFNAKQEEALNRQLEWNRNLLGHWLSTYGVLKSLCLLTSQLHSVSSSLSSTVTLWQQERETACVRERELVTLSRMSIAQIKMKESVTLVSRDRWKAMSCQSIWQGRYEVFLAMFSISKSSMAAVCFPAMCLHGCHWMSLTWFGLEFCHLSLATTDISCWSEALANG